MASKGKNIFNWSFFLVIVSIIVVVNVIGYFVDERFDMTSDKRYSLNESTIDYLSNKKNFDDRLVFKIYLGGNLPAEVVRLRSAIESKLKEFKRYAGKRIEYIILDPNVGTKIIYSIRLDLK